MLQDDTQSIGRLGELIYYTFLKIRKAVRRVIFSTCEHNNRPTGLIISSIEIVSQLEHAIAVWLISRIIVEMVNRNIEVMCLV